MFDPRTPDTPPEVPDEFAEAYRAAYQAALDARSVPVSTGVHAELGDRTGADELPRRARPIRIGAHRAPIARGDDQEVDGISDAALTLFERISRSAWFVPLLLVILALVLVLVAYAMGKAFAGHVAPGGSNVHESRVASRHAEPADREPLQSLKGRVTLG